MGLTAGQKAWTVAASGLLRSDASRSGFSPIGRKVLLYALSNVARSNATRSNYHGPRSFITINDVPWGGHRQTALEPGILIDSLRITDNLNQLPNTCQFTAWGFQPREGQRVTITLGSMNGSRLFHGRVLNTEQYYKGLPKNLYTSVNAIDDTWGLDTRKVSELYTGWSYEAIVRDLIAKYAAPEYTVAVESGLGSLDEITFTNEDLPSALTRLAKRGGYAWLVDEWAVVRFFLTDTWGTPPSIVNAVHTSLDDFQMTRDLSQVITRVYVEGGGILAAATVSPGETILPLAGASTWYDPAGGTVVSGPQRIRYTGVSAGGGGGLVGPGASPSGRPILALASGTGLTDGTRSYAVTYTTASGESIPSPPAAITSGQVPPPVAAPVVGAPTIGTGPDPGPHTYVVTFVTAAGETTPGPPVDVVTGETTPPTDYPVPGVPIVQTAAGVTLGTHEYAVSFVTAAGETTVGPIGPSVTTTPLPAPASSPTVAVQGTASSGVEPGAHGYAVSFVTATGETTPGPIASLTGPPIAAPVGQPTFTPAVSAGSLTPGTVYYWSFTYADGLGNETAGGPWNAAYIATATAAQYTGFPPDSSFGMRYVNVYRTTGNGLTFYLEFENYLPGNIHSGVLFGWNVTDAVLVTRRQAPAPTPVIAITSNVLSAIPVGDASVTDRRIYRTSAAGSQLRLLATLSNNTATTYLDTQTDLNLGANAPTSNTATVNNRIPVTAIPVGPAGVTSRKLYRRSGGVGLRYLATISNNSATTYTDSTDNAALGAAPPATTTATLTRFALSAIPTGPALVIGRRLYRTAAGGSTRLLLAELLNNTTTTYTDSTPDSGLGVAAPVTNTAAANRVQVTGISIGASGVTSRKLYRTVAYGSTLQLLVVLADNTTTTYLDQLADAALGAVAPSADTSGLQQPSGSVSVGAISFQVASIGVFPVQGWAVIGNGQQVIRYTAVVGNSITGIPATGPGSITAAIAYNSTVTAAPALTGIPASGTGAIRYSIRQGDEVNLWVQRDDLAAQAEVAALLGTDGILEGYLQDRRLSQTEAESRGDAHLALRSAVEVGVTYTCRDVNTRAGRTANVNLPTQHTIGTFILQSVGIDRFGVPNLLPTFHAVAAANRFTFVDLLRAARKDGT